MRPDGNPLDLNNLPDDNSSRSDHHAKQLLPADTTSTSPPVTGYKEKESGDGKDECGGKVYECRFCSLKFCKSQALGGHMNRHRQEKETEKLNNARQLLLRNDHNLVAQAALHLGCYPPIATAGYHPAGNIGIGDHHHHHHHHPTMPLRFPTSFSAGGSSSSTHVQQPSQVQQYLFSSSPSRPMTFPPHLLPHVMSNNQHQQYVAGGGDQSSYTCIGAPVGQGFQDHHSSTINRFQDGL